MSAPAHHLEQQQHAGQYLTFLMAEHEYAVDILQVQEIRAWEGATPIPNAPEYVQGVLNLRGTIVPVIDLRLRFGLEKVPYSELTVVIVLSVSIANKAKTMAIVVDGVSDVYSINEHDALDAPEYQDSSDNELIDGLVSVDDKLVVLLNLPKVLDC